MTASAPYKIGLLASMHGATAELEMSQWRGAQQALCEINGRGGVDGRELVAIHYDPESDPARFRKLAEKLLLEDGVNAIFGGYTSSSRKAMLPVVERHNRLLIYCQQYEGFEFSENIIYSGASPNQNGVQLADFMSEHYGARVYMVGSRYVYPYECNRTMQELLLQRPEGAVLGERYLDLAADYAQFEDVIADIKKKQPDFIFSTVIGRTISHLYRAYRAAWLDPQRMPIGSLNTSETEIRIMGAEIAEGHYTSAPYFQTVDTPENHAAVSHHARRHGAECPTDMNWEAAYYQVHMYANALAQAGSDEYEAITPHLYGAEYQAPQGRIRLDPANHHMALYSRIGLAGPQGQFEIVRQSAQAVAPDPYMAPQKLGDWVTKFSTRG